VKTVTIAVEFTVEDKVDPTELADALLDYLCDGGDGTEAYPPQIFSVDNTEVRQ
jgi:hypothetical protein